MPKSSTRKLATTLLIFAVFVGAHEVVSSAVERGGNSASIPKAIGSKTAKRTPAAQQKRAARTYGSLPLGFEPNEGQAGPSVKFVSHGAGYAVLLTAKEAVVSEQEPEETDRLLARMDNRTRRRFEARKFYQFAPRFRRRSKAQIVRVAFEGANSTPDIVALNQLPARANYFVGRDPERWRTGIPTYGSVQYKSIYPGIDLLYYGRAGRLEFDFVVAPGADPNLIRFRLDARRHVSIREDGRLQIGGPRGSFALLCPEIYQVREGKRVPIRGRFVLRADKKVVGIELAKYDRDAKLVIDPALSYSTYIGGSGTDYDSGVAVDAQGNAYIAGMTTSTDFPTYNGYGSSGNSNGLALVTELNPTGTAVLYSTYLGGTGGDWAAGMALDPSGKVYVTGATLSNDFPVVNGFQTSLNSPNGNAFVAVIDTTQIGTASLVYSTYLGGGGNASNSLGDVGLAIAADASGYAYVTGQTASDASTAAFPTTSTAVQSSLAGTNGNAFLTVLDTTNGGPISLLYSTYLGGTSGGFGDYGLGITVDSLRNAYLTGQTTSTGSTPFPTTASAYQTTLNSQYGNVFVTELANEQNGSRSLAYSTYLGGSSASIVGDTGSSIGVDAAGKIYVGGDTTSVDFPVTAGAFQTTNSNGGKAFLASFDPTQTGTHSLVYSTFLGGTDGGEGEVANALAIDSNGDAFVAGSTSSSDFPTTSDAFQTTLNNSSWDAFLSELDPTGAGLVYSTYFGGSCANGDLGNGVAVDLALNAHLGGTTCSTDLPTTAGAYQTTLAGARNAFVSEIPLPASVASIQTTPLNAAVVSGMTQQFSATATLNNGNTEDVTESANWVSSNPGVLSVAALPQTQGFGVGLSVGTTSVTATLGTLTASTTVTVVSAPPTPVITSVSPASGQAGTQVTVSGSGFGASQGRGYLWLGTARGAVSSWSDSQIVATVAAISNSGTVQVTQGGIQSNSLSFTVATPTITSVSPTGGIAGTQVTITGSGFGATQGNGQVWLGSTNGVVSAWSDTQVVAAVASGSASGNAQILQGGVWSNSVPFTINTPTIASITPTSGTAGTSVTITGSGFGSSQGSGTVWIGGAYATVTSWSGGAVAATVGNNAVTGVAKVEQNGTWSNAVQFVVPLPPGSGTPIILVPNLLSMVVGDTRSIEAVKSNNQPVSGLNWSSSNTGILTLSTDDPPVLTAVAPGNVTVYAGNASADVTVFAGSSFPTGTVQWSNPGDGSGVSQIIPAVPSSSGVDVFSLNQSGNVQAITADGTVAWTTNVSNAINSSNLPFYDASPISADFLGGVVAYTGSSIYSLDAQTGQANPAYVGTSSWDQFQDQNFGPALVAPVVHTDGTIFTIDSSCAPQDCTGMSDSGTGSWVVGIDPSSGTAKFKVQAANSSSQLTRDSYCGGPVVQTTHSSPFDANVPNPMIIAGDGYLYTTYQTIDGADTFTQGGTLPFPLAAYTYWQQFVSDSNAGNLSAELGDLSAMEQSTGNTQLGSSLKNLVASVISDLQNNDLDDAALLEIDYIEPLIKPLCNESYTGVSKLHLLRVGSDGSSSDVVLKQWSFSEGLVYSPTPGNPYHYTQVQSRPNVGVLGQLITNADAGVVLSWEEDQFGYCAVATDSSCSATVAEVTKYHLITTAGGQLTNDVVMNQIVPGQSSPVTPTLQLEDGSFVGTVSGTSGNSMVAFDASGNINWTVPNYNPMIATADGGIIARSWDGSSTATFDGGGNATAQLSSLPTFSWKGAYQLGSVKSVAVPIPTLLASFAAVFGGNLSGNGTAGVQHYIDVKWCGTGYAEMGSCGGVGGVDIPWKYRPHVLEDNFEDNSAKEFAADHPDWVDKIEAAAFNSLQKAFSQFPVTVERAAPHSTAWWQCIKNFEWPGCNRVLKVYMSGVWPGDNGTGETTGVLNPFSFVYYWIALQNSEAAISENPPYPPQTDGDNHAFAQLLTAIGTGLGNSTAHELAHQMAYRVNNLNVDCNESTSNPCAGGDLNVFELYGASSWFYSHVFPAIHWQNQNNGSVCAIHQFFDSRYRDHTCTQDLTK